MDKIREYPEQRRQIHIVKRRMKKTEFGKRLKTPYLTRLGLALRKNRIGDSPRLSKNPLKL